VTERVRLGPAALNAHTLHPVEIAGQVAALDLASGGRAYLGLVTGSWLDQLGLDERRPLTRLREAVEIVRRLLARDRSGFAGERFTLAPGAGLAYEPLRREVPLLIGTWRPHAASYAREEADEVKIGGCANPDMVRLMRSWLGNDGPRIVVGAVTVVDEDSARAREHASMRARRCRCTSRSWPTSTQRSSCARASRHRSRSSRSPGRRSRSPNRRSPFTRPARTASTSGRRRGLPPGAESTSSANASSPCWAKICEHDPG
jgi:alkanesulfonate monooxygenase SsuD/methylene tetrahydromethanopterin reductase-like flavin-dependent oxidoreductase (luciferase family)